MKLLSDIDMMANGTFGIEWQETSGGRWWETFNTEEEREEVLKLYDIECDNNKEEIDKFLEEYKINEEE